MSPADNRHSVDQTAIAHLLRCERPDWVIAVEFAIDTAERRATAALKPLSNCPPAVHGAESTFIRPFRWSGQWASMPASRVASLTILGDWQTVI